MKTLLALSIMVLALSGCEKHADVSCIPGGVLIGPGTITHKQIDKEKIRLGCEGNLIQGSGQDVTTIK